MCVASENNGVDKMDICGLTGTGYTQIRTH